MTQNHLDHLLNSDRKKIPLTNRVNYLCDEQDVHLYLNANKTRQKCHVNYVGGTPERSVTTTIAWGPGKKII